jgi:hypothetical protein
MQQQNYQDLAPVAVETLDIGTLRKHWSSAWNLRSHQHMSRKMLVRSLIYKIQEAHGAGLNADQKAKLDQLVKAYKRSRTDGTKRQMQIKSGTQLIREWHGKRHTVTVQNGFFEYNAKTYKSLSAIASEITRTRWNGWVFFGVKKISSGAERP